MIGFERAAATPQGWSGDGAGVASGADDVGAATAGELDPVVATGGALVFPHAANSTVAMTAAARRRFATLQSMAPVLPARHLLNAKDLVDARYFEPLTVADMARAAGLSRAHFSREFHRAFGESPHQYLLTRRLERAAALLRATDRSVADICVTVGLSSVGSFTSSFRRIYGLAPLEYRRAFPPAQRLIRIPECVARAYGRPRNRTFREDERAGEARSSST